MRHEWWIAGLIGILVSGCANAEGRFSAPGIEYTGDPMGAALVGYAYIQGQNPAPEVKKVDCSTHETASGAAECERRLAQRELIEGLGGGEEQEKSLPVSMMEIQARKEIATKSNWFNLANTALAGTLSLVGMDIRYDAQVASDREMFKTFRSFSENGGVRSYALEDVEGDFSFAEIGRDGNLAGRDLGQGSVNGPLVGEDNAPVQDSDGVVGGIPGITCGGPGDIQSCPNVNPSDPDDVRNDASLF